MWAWPNREGLAVGSALILDGQVAALLALPTRLSFSGCSLATPPLPPPTLHAMDTCILVAMAASLKI